MRKYIKYIIIAFVTLTMVSCSSTRQYPFKSFSLLPVTKKGLVREIEKTENSEKYTQISRFSADYSGEQEQSSFKGFARVAQDSMLMMSLSAMVGGEVMRIILSPDTSMILNRYESTYSMSSYNIAQQIIPLPYNWLQAILGYHFSDLITSDYTLGIQEKMYLLENKKQNNQYAYVQIDGNYYVRKLFYKDFKLNTSVSVIYNSFVEVEGTLFPQDVEVTIQYSKEVVVLRLSFKRVAYKTSLDFPFKVSSRYVRID